eukprot:m.309539 g.309539  ORF g.309539 m.309539 type:complete len:242 (+) comp46802_c0_seq1:39-764(+)
MQNPNEDTQWNDILREKGILPPKREAEVTEEQLGDMVEKTITKKEGGPVRKEMEDMSLDELDELEDEEDERVMLRYRQKRLAEMKLLQQKNKFGEVMEISAVDYVQEVNRAGEGIWVVLLLYKQGIPLCSLVNRHLSRLASKFPATKFLKSVSAVCIPNYPDRNLPTIFVYYENEMKGQMVGPQVFGGMNLAQDELEWSLSKIGAVQTDLEENPWEKRRIDDLLSRRVGVRAKAADSDDDD